MRQHICLPKSGRKLLETEGVHFRIRYDDAFHKLQTSVFVSWKSWVAEFWVRVRPVDIQAGFGSNLESVLYSQIV